MGLNPKQIRFCEEYLVDLNATQAAVRAGYSEKSAKVIGSENLTKPDIQEYIQNKQKVIQQKLDVTQERVLQEYARLAFFDIRKIYTEKNSLIDVRTMDDDSAAAVAGIEVFEEFSGYGETREHIGNTMKVKIHNKVAALDALGRHLGLFEKDNKQGQQIIVPMNDQQVDKVIAELKKLK